MLSGPVIKHFILVFFMTAYYLFLRSVVQLFFSFGSLFEGVLDISELSEILNIDSFLKRFFSPSSQFLFTHILI